MRSQDWSHRSPKKEDHGHSTPPANDPRGQPQPGPYSPQAAPPAPAPKKPFYQKIWFWALVIVVVILAFALGGGGNKDKSTTGSTAGSSTSAATAPDATKAPEVAGVNTTVTADGFEVTDNKVDAGVTAIGQDPLAKDAKGQFVVVSINVNNTGDKAEFVSTNNVKLKSGGKESEPDASAAMYLAKDAFLFEKLNPGSELKGKLAFDVPADSKVEILEFAGGFFSKPVVIDLTR